MSEQILNIDLAGTGLDRPSRKCVPEAMWIGVYSSLIT
jgi:hypothetical protein|tara:strand:+ start:279 stop:392 length:114 start_codon:yes stop_codon:yes gene_type:complete